MYKDDASAPQPNDVKLVTTRVPGLDGTPPGGVARSSAFSIAGNAPLLLRLNPTLTMYYDPFDDAEQAWACKPSGDLPLVGRRLAAGADIRTGRLPGGGRAARPGQRRGADRTGRCCSTRRILQGMLDTTCSGRYGCIGANAYAAQ